MTRTDSESELGQSELGVNKYLCFSEFVLTERDIYRYNCDKKIDFIKKGLGTLTLPCAALCCLSIIMLISSESQN